MMESGKNVKIIVATHKKYRMPEDAMYIPLQVGAANQDSDLGYEKDNSAENISYKNSNYCELTGLYWAWKNIDADYIGLVHYRRHFALKKGKCAWDCILMYDDLKPYLTETEIFVPKKRHYYIESLYSHYAHTHYAEHLDITREIILEKYPEYLTSYDYVIQKTSGYMFNMFIMKKEFVDKYCTWLFDILFEVEKQIDVHDLSDYQKRCFGRISEIIFNVWLDYQCRSHKLSKNQIMEIPCIHMEPVCWCKKGMSFLKAKFFHNRYEGSF